MTHGPDQSETEHALSLEQDETARLRSQILKFNRGSDCNFPGQPAAGRFALYGDKDRQIEKAYTILEFPGGAIELARTSDGEYWVHVAVNHPNKAWEGGPASGKIIDARIDLVDAHADAERGAPLMNPDINHIAIRIGPVK